MLTCRLVRTSLLIESGLVSCFVGDVVSSGCFAYLDVLIW